MAFDALMELEENDDLAEFMKCDNLSQLWSLSEDSSVAVNKEVSLRTGQGNYKVLDGSLYRLYRYCRYGT